MPCKRTRAQPPPAALLPPRACCAAAAASLQRLLASICWSFDLRPASPLLPAYVGNGPLQELFPSGGPSAPGGAFILRRLLRRAGRAAERRGAPEGTRTSSLHPTYLRSAESKMLLRKKGGNMATRQAR